MKIKSWYRCNNDGDLYVELAHHQAILENSSNDYKSWYEVGMCYLKMYSTDAAMYHFQQGLSLKPDEKLLKEAIASLENDKKND